MPEGLIYSNVWIFPSFPKSRLTLLFNFSQREQRKTLRELKAWIDQLERDCAQAQRDEGSVGVQYQVSVRYSQHTVPDQNSPGWIYSIALCVDVASQNYVKL